MNDREKVIKGIRKCLSHKPCSENGCPYENECAVEHLNDPLLRDAITLLKEQEHEEKEVTETIPTGDLFDLLHICVSCGAKVVQSNNYCPNCGKKIKKWE